MTFLNYHNLIEAFGGKHYSFIPTELNIPYFDEEENKNWNKELIINKDNNKHYVIGLKKEFDWQIQYNPEVFDEVINAVISVVRSLE